MRMVKGGSRVLGGGGGGGGQNNRDDCACYGTIHGALARGCDAFGVAGGSLEWGDPLHKLEKLKNLIDFAIPMKY